MFDYSFDTRRTDAHEGHLHPALYTYASQPNLFNPIKEPRWESP